MADETQTPEPTQGAVTQEPAATPASGGGGGFEELQASLKELREKFVTADTTNKKLVEEVESLKGQTQVVDRIKQAIEGGGNADDAARQKAKAEFYRLLVDDPRTAIQQVYRAEREREEAIQRERETEKAFTQFTQQFPEYKDYEEDMKAELLANPGWFGRPNFIQRVFFDVLSTKNPALLAKLISEGRGMPNAQGGAFMYEGSSQTNHGGEPDTGDTIMKRMKAVKPEKSFFE